LPRIDTLLDDLAAFQSFSRLYLQAGYNQMCIVDTDVEKTAFITLFGHCQFQVLSFGLTYAPATFQRLMSKIFAPHIGEFVQVYLDDIIIMSKTPEEHLNHLRLVLELAYTICTLSSASLVSPKSKFWGTLWELAQCLSIQTKLLWFATGLCPATLLSCVPSSGLPTIFDAFFKTTVA
jgi:hypothetical protein